MIYPPITELVKKTGSRYALVIETAKRTRQLVEGAQKLSEVETSKDVTVAVNEIYENKIEAVAKVKTVEPAPAVTDNASEL
ncbi:MAG: DNA-directed RNA polymerase subunit omega [Ruminococcaceae bacterium]|nr:DNA-directed RNA polymerase subunit omega [Oscillospiraceae bacterium]